MSEVFYIFHYEVGNFVYNLSVKSMKNLRIVYLGTPDFSAELLRYLIAEDYNIIAVVTQGDSPVGRKRVLTPSPVKSLALAHNIPVFTPFRIRREYDFLVELKPDLILTFAYGQIVPKAVLDAPKYGCLNFHGSILPKYRGASPIQMALINAERETGVSLMEMVEAMDAGRVFGIQKFKIEPSDNFATIASKMVKASATLIKEVLPAVISGENKGTPQDESQVTFAPLLKAKDEWIDLENDDVKNVLGRIQAFTPLTGATLSYDSLPLKIYEARLENNRVERAIGELFTNDKRLLLQVKGGQIEILQLQKSGKKIVDAKSFINGEQSKLPTLLKGYTDAEV